SSERTFAEEAPPGEQLRHRMQLRCFERLLSGQVREDGREAPRQHGLAGPGRTDHQEVVTARSRDLQRASRLILTADLRQVCGACGDSLAHQRSDLRWTPGPSEAPDDLLA